MTKLKDLHQDWILHFDKPLIISGPCSAETQEQVLETAKRMNKSYVQVFRAGIWKPRTKPGSFEGIGEIGLQWLQKAKKETGMLIATEVANATHVKAALAHDVDILWIGARSTVNPFTVQEIAEALKNTEKIILVKNPVHPDFDLWVGALERLAAQGIKKLGVIHRGFSAYKKSQYRNQPHWQIALDFRNHYPNIPILCDPSHICGEREGIAAVAQQAFNFEYDGLMVETHRKPEEAWSDAKQQITPERLLEILKNIELRKEDDTQDIEYQKKLSGIRTQIDELDHNILALLVQRLRLAEEVGMLKKNHNIAIFQPKRWVKITERLGDFGHKLGLSVEFTENLLKIIHQESINIQNQIMLEGPKKDR